MATYNANTNWNNEKTYLNNLINTGSSGQAAWAQSQMNELNAAQSQYSTPAASQQTASHVTTGQSVNAGNNSGSVYVPTVGGNGTVNAVTGQTNTQGNQITYGTAPSGGTTHTDNTGTTWYSVGGIDYNMSAPVPGTNTSGTVWSEEDTNKAYNWMPKTAADNPALSIDQRIKDADAAYQRALSVQEENARKEAAAQAQQQSQYEQLLAQYQAEAAAKQQQQNDYLAQQQAAYTAAQAQQQAQYEASQAAAAAQAEAQARQQQEIITQYQAAQAAAEEAARQKTNYNIGLIDQQMAGLSDQEAQQRGQIYQDSRVSALQNAERQAAMGIGGNPYDTAPTGYAESARLREDANLRTLLNDVSQQTMDAQRALDNMKTNAAVLGEGEINQVTSDWASKLADINYQLTQDANAAQYQQWQMSQAEQQAAFSQQQQLWDNEFRVRSQQIGLDQASAEQALQVAKIQASYGDFSGYGALGINTTQMQNEWQRQLALEAQQASMQEQQLASQQQNTAFQQQQQLWENEFRTKAQQIGIDQYTAEQQLQNAKTQAAYGDFSGYRALGIDTTQMETEWQRQLALEAQQASSSSGSGSTSSTDSTPSTLDMTRRAEIELSLYGELHSADLIAYFGGNYADTGSTATVSSTPGKSSSTSGTKNTVPSTATMAYSAPTTTPNYLSLPLSPTTQGVVNDTKLQYVIDQLITQNPNWSDAQVEEYLSKNGYI